MFHVSAWDHGTLEASDVLEDDGAAIAWVHAMAYGPDAGDGAVYVYDERGYLIAGLDMGGPRMADEPDEPYRAHYAGGLEAAADDMAHGAAFAPDDVADAAEGYSDDGAARIAWAVAYRWAVADAAYTGPWR